VLDRFQDARLKVYAKAKTRERPSEQRLSWSGININQYDRRDVASYVSTVRDNEARARAR
jgi:hypothetical protein